ncbi:hypothetical protein [Faecalimicrobium dakarense]|uniref:hypothetical protein n=1 Tax=Faecalimicrobium dakarense TaxID=1301100 RepID=UPI0005A9AE16|nr:hypothetical protein [[Clostridium] dakarense]
MNIYPKSFSKKDSNKLLNLLNFNNSFLYDDILPYDDSDYCNNYDDIILEDDNYFDHNFYQDDTLNYFD